MKPNFFKLMVFTNSYWRQTKKIKVGVSKYMEPQIFWMRFSLLVFVSLLMKMQTLILRYLKLSGELSHISWQMEQDQLLWPNIKFQTTPLLWKYFRWWRTHVEGSKSNRCFFKVMSKDYKKNNSVHLRIVLSISFHNLDLVIF